MSKYQRHLYLSIVFYKYLNKTKHPNALESLTEDNIYTVFKDFNYLCKDPFYKTIFSQVVKYSHQEMKEALIVLQRLKLNTIDDLKKYFIELVEDKQSVDYVYYKMVKEV